MFFALNHPRLVLAVLEIVPKFKDTVVLTREDIVFDVYWSSSLKAETRSKRGIGARRRVLKDSFMGIHFFVLDQMRPTVFLHQGPAEVAEH
jgi:hypothetical protein